MVDLVVRMPGVADAGATLGNGTYLVGSGEECHIRLPRPDISRRHAQLIISESAIVILDMGSSNGTTLDDGTQLFPHQPRQLENAVNVVHISKATLILSKKEEKRLLLLQMTFLPFQRGISLSLKFPVCPLNTVPLFRKSRSRLIRNFLQG